VTTGPSLLPARLPRRQWRPYSNATARLLRARACRPGAEPVPPCYRTPELYLTPEPNVRTINTRTAERGCQSTVSPVEKWTGEYTRALREALRMTVREFAEHLGVTDRTVSKWEAPYASGNFRPETQQILDTALRAAPEEVRERFDVTASNLRVERPLLLAVLVARDEHTHEEIVQGYNDCARAHDEDAALSPRTFRRWLRGDVQTQPRPAQRRVARLYWGYPMSQLLEPAPSDLSTVDRSIVDNETPTPADLTVDRSIQHFEIPYADPSMALSGQLLGEEMPTNRREVIHLGGAAMAGAFIERLWSEPAKLRMAMDRGSVGSTWLAGLIRDANDLSVRVVQAPPATLVGEALAAFRDIRKAVSAKQSLAMQRELTRCAALFATVLGEILFNEGQFHIARRWYDTARTAAIEAGDQYHADIALAGGTYLAMYTPDPKLVLDSVTPRLAARYTSSPAIAWLWAFSAKAHAMLGERHEFERAMSRATQALEDSPPDLVRPGILSFRPEKLAFYEARGWIELNDADAAASAASRAIMLYDFSETTEPALVRFEQASALAKAGELSEACQIATNALLDQRTYHGVTVRARAGEFDRLLGSTSGTEVREWREVLATVRTPQLILGAGPGEKSRSDDER
jgi:DNA-binding transcriptional regulator YiaG/tetratricopeptide (TPR) repeat protein